MYLHIYWTRFRRLKYHNRKIEAPLSILIGHEDISLLLRERQEKGAIKGSLPRVYIYHTRI